MDGGNCYELLMKGEREGERKEGGRGETWGRMREEGTEGRLVLMDMFTHTDVSDVFKGGGGSSCIFPSPGEVCVPLAPAEAPGRPAGRGRGEGGQCSGVPQGEEG